MTCHRALQPHQAALRRTTANAAQPTEVDRDDVTRYMNAPIQFDMRSEIQKATHTLLNFCARRRRDAGSSRRRRRGRGRGRRPASSVDGSRQPRNRRPCGRGLRSSSDAGRRSTGDPFLRRRQRHRGLGQRAARAHRVRVGARVRDDDAGRVLLLRARRQRPRRRADAGRRLVRAVGGHHGRRGLGLADRRRSHRHAHRLKLAGRGRRVRVDGAAVRGHGAVAGGGARGSIRRDQHDGRRRRRVGGVFVPFAARIRL